jgi:thiamine biosynthesis protein ThiI
MLYLIRYGEIALKSNRTRRAFKRQLVNNIKSVLNRAGIKNSIYCTWDRIFVECEKPAQPFLKRIFGITSFSPCQKCKPDLKSIKRAALAVAKEIIKPGQTFAVRTKGPQSQKINEIVGRAILVATKGKVKLKKPRHVIGIEIKDKGYIFVKKIPGPGGLPEGVGGNVLALINKKEDLKAAWLAMRRGCRVIPVFKHKYGLQFFKKWSAFPLKYYRYKKISDIKKIAKMEKVYGIVLTNQKLKKFDLPIFRPLLPYQWLKRELKINN